MTANPVSTAPVVECFTLGPYETNCYLVRTQDGAASWIVDAGFEPAPLIDRARTLRVVPSALVLTHAHLDHIAGVRDVLRAFPRTPVWIHEAEKEWLSDPELNLSIYAGIPVTAPGPDRTLTDGDTLELGPTHWRVLHRSEERRVGKGRSYGWWSSRCARRIGR